MIRHLTRGLLILGEQWTSGARRWIGAGENWLDTGVRWAIAGGVAYGAARLLLSSLPGVAVVAVAVCVLALRAATKAARGAQPATKPSPAAPTPTAEEGLVDVPADELTDLVRDLLAGAPGVHLSTLANALGDGWTTTTVRAVLAAHGIRVRPSVRDAARRVSPGVHRDDLPPLPGPSPAAPQEAVAGVVVAGQIPTTDATTEAPTTPTTHHAGGVRITSTPDATNPHRTHITVHNPTRKKP